MAELKAKAGIAQSLRDGITSLTSALKNSRSVDETYRANDRILTDSECEALMLSGVSARILSIKVDWSLRNGFVFKSSEQEKYYNEKIRDALFQTVTNMLAFGRGLLVFSDGTGASEQSKPLGTINKNTVEILPFEGSLFTTSIAEIENNVMDKNYWKPNKYTIKGTLFDKSRVIDFVYKKPPLRKAPTYLWGGVSEFELLYKQLIADEVMQKAVPSIFEKSANYIYKIPGFDHALQTGKEKDIVGFYGKLERLRSSYGASLVDKETDITQVSQTLTNLDSTNIFTLQRLALVSGIPLPFLVGEAVKGLNSTGDHEMNIMQTTISSLQQRYILPKANELFERLGFPPAEMKVPDELSRADRVEYETKVMIVAQGMIDLGLDPAEYLKKNDMITDDDMTTEVVV